MAEQCKQLVILSGKGGTGKTSISAALAAVISKALDSSIASVDADVDAANLAMLYHPQIEQQYDFSGGEIAHIDPRLCSACGICAQTCRFDAILAGPVYAVDPIACEGCAACAYTCPEQAISLHEETNGIWYQSQSTFGPFFHAELNPGGENSGKLVSLLKQQAVKVAAEQTLPLILVDGPPGTGCPAIAACSGADLALLVTEPGLAAFHDLKRITATVRHFNLPCVLCINKADINPQIKAKIMDWAVEQHIPLIGEINFDEKMIECVLQGEIITQSNPQSNTALLIRELWQKLAQQM